MSMRTGLTVVLWAAFGLGVGAVGSAHGDNHQSPQTAQACTEGGYMLVMGGIEDPSTVPDRERARLIVPPCGVWWSTIMRFTCYAARQRRSTRETGPHGKQR